MIRLVPGFTLLVFSAVSDVGPAQFASSWAESGSAQAAQYEAGEATLGEAPEELDEQQRRRDGNDSDGMASSLGTQVVCSVRCRKQPDFLDFALRSRILDFTQIRGPPRA